MSALRMLLVIFPIATAAAQTPAGTEFTYQGSLKDGGSAANGTYDLRFTLYDSLVGGAPQGSPDCADNISVIDGLFTLELDFGAQFAGQERFLEIAVRADTGLDCGNSGGFVTLIPRQALTAAPYALALPGLYTQPNATSPNVLGGHSANNVTAGVFGATIGGGGNSYFPNLVTADYGAVGGGASNAAGAYGAVGGGYFNTVTGAYATISGGTLNFVNNGYGAIGGGYSNAVTGSSSTVGGGHSNTASSPGSTVGGGWENTASGSYGTVGGGVLDVASGDYSTVGGGVYNEATGYSAAVGGGYDNTASGDYSTVSGGRSNQAGGDCSFAGGRQAQVRDPIQVGGGDVDGDQGTFVWADSTAASFTSTGPHQFLIRASGGVGIGTNAPDTTLHVGTGADASLASGSGYALLGTAAGANVVMDNDEIMARNNGAASTLWLNHDGGNVVVGNTNGYSTLHVEGATGNSGFRVRFDNNTKLIVSDNGSTSIGSSTVGPANGLRVAGGCDVLGTLTKGGGSFKIDHPLDPENYYLYHSFVESPDMMNIYNGNVVTDEKGYAVVKLPDWFEALNRDFRYQLTVLDEDDSESWTLAKVVQGVTANRFAIRTSAPHTKVSWQVTGIRKDAWAEQNRIPVEVEKEAENRGRYLHPEAFGMSPDWSMSDTPEPDAADWQAASGRP